MSTEVTGTAASSIPSQEIPPLVEDSATQDERYRSDPALIQACVDGDGAAWDELVERYGRLVYAIARRAGLSAEDADDVFQSVFMIVMRRLDSLRDQTRLSSWLITTTSREAWRVRRRVAVAPTTELDEATSDRLVDPGLPPPEEAVRLEREQTVREAMGRLDDRCRELLTALFLEPGEPSYGAISERLDMPIGSIGPTRTRCFRKLERILAELGYDGRP